MAYKSFRLGGGLNNKLAADAIPDDALTTCQACSFDEVGTLSSGRGRDKINSGTAVGSSGSILGHFDGKVSGTKYRFTKRGTDVYRNFTTDLGTPAALWPGKTAVDFSSTSNLTGFAYGDYVYMADGTTTARFNGTTAEAWGLTAPGYQVLSNATPITTESGDATITVTTPYPLHSGMSSSQNIELVGMEPVGTTVGADINKLHFSNTAFTNADVDVTGGDLNTAAIDIEFQRLLAATSFTKIEADTSLLTGSFTLTWARVSGGKADPPTNEVQRYTLSGATGGSIRFKHEGEWTSNIAYNASAATVEAAFIALPNVGGTPTTTTVATVTGASTFTFEASANADGTDGGGSIGFMRQGPICAITTSGGGLEEGRYFYAYSFYNGVAESNISAQVPVEIGTRNSKVDLSQVLAGPAGTTERRIYRTDVNGRQLYYVGKIGDNTTTTYTDLNKLPPGADPWVELGDVVVDAEFEESVLSRLSGREQARRRALIDAENASRRSQRTATNLGLQMNWTDHDPPPVGLEEVGILNETAMGIEGGELVFAEAGNPEHWPLSNRLKPGRNTSEKALTWRAFDRDCIIYTASGLYRFSQVGLDFRDGRFEEIESPVGLAGKRAVALLDGQKGHVFLATNGLYLFDGARCSEISYPIEKLFTDEDQINYINPSYMSSAVMTTSRDRLYMAYATSSSGNDRMLMVDFQDMANPKFTVFVWSYTMLTRERTDNTLLAGDSSGYVYQLDTGWTDDGSAIYWLWTTKQYRLNGGAAFMLDEVILDANLAGASTAVTVTMQQRDSTKTATFTLSDTGRQRITMKVPTYMKGEGVTVVVASSGAVERKAHEIGFTYMPMGEP